MTIPTYSPNAKRMVVEASQQIGGWLLEQEADWLYDAAWQAGERAGGFVGVEIGFWKGRSASILCSVADAFAGTVFSVDHFLGSGATQQEKWDNLMGEVLQPSSKRAMLEGIKETHARWLQTGRLFILHTLHTIGWDSLKEVLAWRRADICWLDGDHAEMPTREDCLRAKQVIAPTGIICGHDYKPNENGVPRAVDAIFPQRKIAPNTSIWWVLASELPG